MIFSKWRKGNYPKRLIGFQCMVWFAEGIVECALTERGALRNS